MYKIKKLDNLALYFSEDYKKQQETVIFYRISGYSNFVSSFIDGFYTLAKKNGMLIEGKLQNPTEGNLDYYDAIIGKTFEMNQQFFMINLKKWLPRLGDKNTQLVAKLIFESLTDMQARGKNEGILKNAYIKYMCWFYYKFEQVVIKLSQNQKVPILYQGDISVYELEMLSILSKCGCDIVL